MEIIQFSNNSINWIQDCLQFCVNLLFPFPSSRLFCVYLNFSLLSSRLSDGNFGHTQIWKFFDKDTRKAVQKSLKKWERCRVTVEQAKARRMAAISSKSIGPKMKIGEEEFDMASEWNILCHSVVQSYMSLWLLKIFFGYQLLLFKESSYILLIRNTVGKVKTKCNFVHNLKAKIFSDLWIIAILILKIKLCIQFILGLHLGDHNKTDAMCELLCLNIVGNLRRYEGGDIDQAKVSCCKYYTSKIPC